MTGRVTCANARLYIRELCALGACGEILQLSRDGSLELAVDLHAQHDAEVFVLQAVELCAVLIAQLHL